MVCLFLSCFVFLSSASFHLSFLLLFLFLPYLCLFTCQLIFHFFFLLLVSLSSSPLGYFLSLLLFFDLPCLLSVRTHFSLNYFRTALCCLLFFASFFSYLFVLSFFLLYFIASRHSIFYLLITSRVFFFPTLYCPLMVFHDYVLRTYYAFPFLAYLCWLCFTYCLLSSDYLVHFYFLCFLGCLSFFSVLLFFSFSLSSFLRSHFPILFY